MSRSNNFDFLRLAGALLVLIGHHFVLLGYAAPRFLGLPVHSLGVSIFFSISGVLITGSIDRSPSRARFLWHRFLRVVPGLLCLVTFTTFIIGPILSSLDLVDYFGSTRTWGYLLNIPFVTQYELPGVFDAPPHVKPVVNGSLWTLGVEVCCYLGILLAASLPSALRGAAYLSSAATLAMISFTHVQFGSTADLAVFLALGASVKIFIPTKWLGWPLATVAILGLAGFSIFTTEWIRGIALWVLLPLAVAAIGSASTRYMREIARWGDFSYGIYLWGYLVEQIVVGWFGRSAMLASFVCALVMAFGVAALSWHWVERPALSLKGRRPKWLTTLA
jgi:peptidoglycan/LPS O-acetylase OafA/YrhL